MLALAAAAEALQREGAALSIHWETAVTSVDLGARQLVALHSDGREERVSYDLLVGADGWASVVRMHETRMHISSAVPCTDKH